MAIQSVSPISFESVSAVTLSNSVELGSVRIEAGIQYVYVYNGGAASIAQGAPARLSPSSLSSGYTVVVSNPASQSGGEFVVGVAHNAAIAASSYGWLATRGVVFGVPDASAVSMNSGDAIALGVDGGFVVAPATLATGLRLGVCLNSFITTVGTGKILFKSPLYG